MNKIVEGHLSGSEGPGIDAQVGQCLLKAKVDSFLFIFFIFFKKKMVGGVHKHFKTIEF